MKKVFGLVFIMVVLVSASAFADAFDLRQKKAYEAVDGYFQNLIKRIQPSLHCSEQKFDVTLIRKEAIFQFDTKELVSDNEGHLFITTDVLELVQNESDLEGLLAVMMAFSEGCAGKIQEGELALDQFKKEVEAVPSNLLLEVPKGVVQAAYELVELPLALATFDVQTLTRINSRGYQRESERIVDAQRKQTEKITYSEYLNAEWLEFIEEKASFRQFLTELEKNKIDGIAGGALIDSKFWNYLKTKIPDSLQTAVPKRGDELENVANKIREISELLKNQSEQIARIAKQHYKSPDLPRNRLEELLEDRNWQEALAVQELIVVHHSSAQFLNREINLLWDLQKKCSRPRANNLNDPFPGLSQEMLDLTYRKLAVSANGYRARTLVNLAGLYYRQLDFERAELIAKEGLENIKWIEDKENDSSPFLLHELLRNIYLIQGRYNEALDQQKWILSNAIWKTSGVMVKPNKHVKKIIEKARDQNLDPDMLEYGKGFENIIEIKGSPSSERFRKA